jgi:zinc transport system substrate-binding protein
MRRQRGIAAFAVVALMTLITGCSRSTPLWRNRGGPPRVVVTIPALDNFVRNVGGDHVGIVCLCTTQGPHHYQDNAQDAILLRQADLFFAIGLTLDDKFADPIQIQSHNPHLQYVKLGERLPKKLLRSNEAGHEHGKEEEDHDHEHEHGHEHGEYDPHVWLGIAQAVALVEIIRDELKKVDAAHADDYDANAKKYIEKLNALQTYGKEKLKDKKNRNLIAFHESLGYFAKSFDLNIVDVLEVIPGTEAGSARLVKLVKECREKNVRVIAVEPQYPKENSADDLKRQKKDLELVVVDPLETVEKKDLKEDEKELKNPDWFEKKMRQNLDNLAKSLP